MKLPPVYLRWQPQKHSSSPPAPTSVSHTLVGKIFWWNGFNKGTHLFYLLISPRAANKEMQQQQWGEMACECFGTCACMSLCCLLLPFTCLTVETAWVMLGCWVREIIILSLASVICLCWFFNQFIELCSRFYWIPRQVKEWDKEQSF